MSTTLKKYMTPDEAGEFIGIGTNTLAKWRCNQGLHGPHGGGPVFIRIGTHKIRYASDDLIAWMDRHRVCKKEMKPCR